VARVGVDSGGTFTDVLAVVGGDGGGERLIAAKVPSTPQDPAEALATGVARVAASVAELVHSTTVATNALLERRGGPTLFVTTRGFEDLLILGRQARPRLYALHPVVPPPLVGPEDCCGVDERVAWDGAIVRALDDAEIARVVAWVKERVAAAGARSVAVVLLHGYLFPAHEARLGAALRAEVGSVAISLSSEVAPLPREYERASTTVADAYVKPLVGPYLARLDGVGARRLRVLRSAGGAVGAAEAAALPVATALSGPAAGVIGAARVAAEAGVEALLTLDVGGTSTDVALIERGAPELRDEGEVAGVPIALPMLAVHTVGAGGGSIARVDAGGALLVGPESAGAEPGPAAYGRGGAQPTVTDALCVLGRLASRGLLGGEKALDINAARAAVAGLAAALGAGSVEEAAEAVVAVAEAQIARALRTISVERGHDPARFVLCAFGGAGPALAVAVARELGCAHVLVPPAPGLLCAYGALAAPVAHRLIAPVRRVLDGPLAARALDAEGEALRAAGRARLAADGVEAGAATLAVTASMRVVGQIGELEVPIGGDDCELRAAFHAAHQARWGYALPEARVELVALRLEARGPLPVLPSLASAEPRDAGEALVGRETAIFAGRAHGAGHLLRRRLEVGARVDGPALILEYSSTTVLPPGARAEVLESGALLISV
jgi:N-methylhydantoinase A